MGEVQQGGLGVREIGNADFDGDNGQHTTGSDRFEVNGVVGEPISSHVKSVYMQHVQTRHVPHNLGGFYKSLKFGNATHARSHRLRDDTHPYSTETAKTAWSSRQTSKPHDPRPQCPGNGSPK